jgi:primosomal protein N' (replication factor Y) (superfamily II helicase)
LIQSSAAQEATFRFAEVAVPVHINRTFIYELPEELQQEASVGCRVLVPFGKKLLTGYIVGLSCDPPHEELEGKNIRSAVELVDREPLLTERIIEITKWISHYYAAPHGEVLKAALPAGVNARIDRIVSIKSLKEEMKFPEIASRIEQMDEAQVSTLEREFGKQRVGRALRELEKSGIVERSFRITNGQTGPKKLSAVRLLSAADQVGQGNKLTATQRRVIDALISKGGEVLLTTLIEVAQVTRSTINSLVAKGILEIFQKEVRRDPLERAILPEIKKVELTSAQSAALSEILTMVGKREYAAFLLHGVTGSGKTEVYIRAMQASLEMGFSALMLVPEIALTPVFSRRLRSCFGDLVAIFHSSLSSGERFDEWARIRNGQARIVIGTRSAVFAPVENLGLVIVDEEHESSYRQHESPYYHGRDTAVMRASKEKAVVVLGSATPSMESFHNAQTGRYRYLRLSTRVGNRPMACAELIDMRKVFAQRGKPEVFSEKLINEIEETHKRGEQTIILLNRRGYSSFVLCRSCGERINCPNCDVTLTYHQSERSIICHYCNYRKPVPKSCPACAGEFIYFVGEGTEQIEEILTKRFPELRIARIDRDTASRRQTYEKTLLDFGAGELDLIVGTQMIAKGHDFHNVTLVGVISVDAGLALPDFRAAERTFQLITQVAGRAGRGDLAGKVFIQTYHPNHYALRHACAQNYEAFYEEEIRYRRSMSYPPFVSLGSLLVHHQDLGVAQSTARLLREALDENCDPFCRVLGPAPAPISRLKGEHRIQLLIKSRSRTRLRHVLDASLLLLTEAGVDLRSINLEIDPVSLI